MNKDIQMLGKKSNLFDQALRQPIKKVGGKPIKRDRKPKKALSRLFSPVGRYGPAECITHFSEGFLEIVYKKTNNHILRMSVLSH